ncbi:ATP-dependent helicase [Metabacillus arenae]|uniref:ATP-dependent helicase n=1 Tax=Metabacillus arenae TaxID=2771434 RepID=UPI0037CB48F9
MDCAKFKKETVRLSTITPDSLQKLYENSLRGYVRCAHCDNPVKLYFSMNTPPAFSHFENGDFTDCEIACLTVEKPSAAAGHHAYAERNGFRIPKGRAITGVSTIEKEKVWDEPKPIRIIESYHPSNELLSHKLIGEISLNTDQERAVTAVHGSLLVLAGAGSGKTRVLTARAAHMIQTHQIEPESMMLVTFTSKAAREMKDRIIMINGLSSNKTKRLLTGTFHSIFYKILSFHQPGKWQGPNLIKWDWQKEQYVKQAGKELGLDEKEFPYDQALQQISFWKNTLLPEEKFVPKGDWEEKVHFLYRHYEKLKHERDQFDFDDMLLKCYELFKQEPHILKKYQERFHYFLVDEFQDINPIQYEMIKMLSAKSGNLCAVGDDDQSIYAFRGSDPSIILNFKKDFPNAEIVHLKKNYRSSHPIVSTAKQIISLNKHRYQKEITAHYERKEGPVVFSPYDEEVEATMIVNDMKEKMENGASPEDFAILYRTHANGRAVFERLHQSSIPFVMEQDHSSFYDRRIVKNLLAFMRLSLNPDHSEAASHLLSALFIKQSALNDLKALSIFHDCTLVEALGKLSNLLPFQQKKLNQIIPHFSKLQRYPPATAIEIIEKDMGFDDYVKKRGNEGNAIEKGSDEIKDLKVVAKKFDDLASFLEHIDHMRAAVQERRNLEKPKKAVQLMTIHRAKGLEFKNVYIVGAVDGSLPHDFALESLRKGENAPLEEERRLLYVAMTRAKHGLYVSMPTMRRGRKANPSRFLRPII